MTNKKLKIDFDFIGEQGSLTSAEELALSTYFKKVKSKKSSAQVFQKKIEPKRKTMTM